MMNSGQDRVKISEQAEFFANRLRKRGRHLAKWARREGTGAYRLYDGDIPEIPLVLDYYEGTQNKAPLRALSGALYKRPYEKDALDEEIWLAAMRQAAARTLELDEHLVFMKERRRGSGSAQYQKHDAAGFVMEVREGACLVAGGLAFQVNLSDYIDSGLFLDARRVRTQIFARAAKKRVLNLFCYTGAFSIYAAAGGAAQVYSVDMSATALKWAAANITLNGQSAGVHRLIHADALRFFEDAHGERWDIIILNPPSFSNSKTMRGETLDIKRDCETLLVRTLRLLAPGGTLYFGSVLRGKTLTGTVAARLMCAFPALKIHNITEQNRPEDFLKKKIPSWWTLSLSG